MPPRQLEAIAIRTPMDSLKASALQCAGEQDVASCRSPPDRQLPRRYSMSGRTSFAGKLRWWREHRGMSQLALAGRAAISQRHLSFLELGRAAPSRDMVLRLAEALDVPLRQHNALLLAAGFAPAWRETELGAPELKQIASAVDYILGKQ